MFELTCLHMRKIPTNCLALLLSLLLPGLAAADHKPGDGAALELYAEDAPGLSWTNVQGELDGVSVDVVQEIQRRVGDHTPIQIVSWARGFNILNRKHDTSVGLFSSAFSEARRDKYRWVGPLIDAHWIFYARHDSSLKISSIDDAKKLPRVGVVAGDVRVKQLQALGFENLVTASTNADLIRMLIGGRIDAWFGDPNTLLMFLLEHDFDHKLVQAKFLYATKGLYIIFNLETPETLIATWQSALESMKADGTFAELLAPYGRNLPVYRMPPRP